MKQEKTITINVPEGYEIDIEKSTFQSIVFKLIQNELPEMWEDLENIDGYYIFVDSEIIKIRKNIKTTDKNKNLFATKEQEEASIALAQLSQLMKVHNGDWVPDWNDPNEIKHSIVFECERIKIFEHFVDKRFLAFKTKELCLQFIANFRNLIKTAKPLL